MVWSCTATPVLGVYHESPLQDASHHPLRNEKYPLESKAPEVDLPLASSRVPEPEWHRPAMPSIQNEEKPESTRTLAFYLMYNIKRTLLQRLQKRLYQLRRDLSSGQHSTTNVHDLTGDVTAHI